MILNNDVLRYILDFVDIETLLTMENIDPFIDEYIYKKDWKIIWQKICIKKKTAINEFHKRRNNEQLNNQDYKEIVNLAGFKGCMFCCNTRINKVYWQYKVRCCKDCLYHKTIGEWEFEKYLDKQHYEHLPYMMRNMYNSTFGSYTISFYWKESIDDLRKLHPYIPPAPQPLIIKKDINIERQNVLDNLLLKEKNDIDIPLLILYSKTYVSIIKAKGKLNVNKVGPKLQIILEEMNNKK